VPQVSNRDQLLEGALRCLQRLPPERVTARAIAREARANLASIGYHFGSKENLVTEAVIEGLDRWLANIAGELEVTSKRAARNRFQLAARLFERSRSRHAHLVRNFVAAIVRAQHDPRVRKLLAAGFRKTRPSLAKILLLGSDGAGEDAAGLVLAMFDGLLLQVLVDPQLAIEGPRMQKAQRRLRQVFF
jgi:AcrR family transcriptional regulator